MNPEERQRQQVFRERLARVEALARITDTGLRIPGTGIRFGLDALIGLVPVVGDFAGLLLSLYVYQQARRLDAPASLRRRMLGNMGVDLVGGLLPVVGDVFDVAWRANARNARLLVDWGEAELAVRESASPETSGAFPHGVLWMALFAVSVGALLYFFRPGGGLW